MWLDIIPGCEETDYVVTFFFLLNYENKVETKKYILGQHNNMQLNKHFAKT